MGCLLSRVLGGRGMPAQETLRVSCAQALRAAAAHELAARGAAAGAAAALQRGRGGHAGADACLRMESMDTLRRKPFPCSQTAVAAYWRVQRPVSKCHPQSQKACLSRRGPCSGSNRCSRTRRLPPLTCARCRARPAGVRELQVPARGGAAPAPGARHCAGAGVQCAHAHQRSDRGDSPRGTVPHEARDRAAVRQGSGFRG